MFDLRKPQAPCKGPIIRVASSLELDEYEKELLKKLDTVEFNAQENKLEDIDFKLNDQNVPVEIVDKTALIDVEVGDLALKDEVTAVDMSEQDTFQIECSLE